MNVKIHLEVPVKLLLQLEGALRQRSLIIKPCLRNGTTHAQLAIRKPGDAAFYGDTSIPSDVLKFYGDAK